MSPLLTLTQDGSPTLFVPELNEHYHSRHGALQESQHVFIEAGLKFAFEHFKSPLKIIEVGMGTGLNTWLTLQTQIPSTYYGIEPFPISLDLLSEFYKTLDWSNASFQAQLYAKPSDIQCLTSHFNLFWFEGPLANFTLDKKAHLVYMDAFAPEKQPELWTKDSFTHLFELLLPGGIMVTYCAKGQVRRDLESVGFKVERLPGPPGKREMLRALKPMV
jgi:tRNA U34 5-methylaminomethyl-2-thiouridine-forming methyltransferase MnmC